MSEIFFAVMEISFQGAVAAAAVLLVRRLTRRKLSARWHMALWLILLLKLLIPYGPYCAVSAFRAVPEVPVEAVFQVQERPSNQNEMEQPAQGGVSQGEGVIRHKIDPARIAGGVWALGAAGALGWYLWANLRFRRRVNRRNGGYVPEELSLLLTRCRERVGIRRQVGLVVQKEVETPCIYGFFNPSILVTPATLALDETKRTHLLLHELCHCRRGDLFLLPVLAVLQSIHWFNPVIWYAFRVLREDMELAADEMVLELLGPEQAMAYGRSLLAVAEQNTREYTHLSAVGMAERKSQLETRIRRIKMNGKSAKKMVVTILGCLCAVVLGVALLTSGEQQGENMPENPSLPGEETGTIGENETGEQDDGNLPADPIVVEIGDLFGFTDESGQQILIPKMASQPEAPEKVDRAVGECGALLTITYLGEQEGTAQDSGRFTADNFANIPGQLYEIEEGAASPGETYYLFSAETFDPRVLLPVNPGDHSPADESLTAELEAAAGRTVEESWLLGDLGDEGEIYLVLFSPQGEELLASIVIATPEGILRRDYPAALNGSSAWRVDDGGTMDPSLFRILFAAKADEELLLGMTWLGAEGESSLLLKQEGSELEELNVLFYRYTAIA